MRALEQAHSICTFVPFAFCVSSRQDMDILGSMLTVLHPDALPHVGWAFSNSDSALSGGFGGRPASGYPHGSGLTQVALRSGCVRHCRTAAALRMEDQGAPSARPAALAVFAHMLYWPSLRCAAHSSKHALRPVRAFRTNLYATRTGKSTGFHCKPSFCHRECC